MLLQVALRWFVQRSQTVGHMGPRVRLEELEKIPGQVIGIRG